MTEPTPTAPDICSCCLGDPDTVCSACGEHSCWAGVMYCQDYKSAGTKQKPAVAPTPLAPELECLALASIATEAERRKKIAKALIGQAYPDGRRESFRSPVDGSKLGMVLRTDPDPTWVVTDRAALEAHLREFPGNLDVSLEIVAEDMPEALAVLGEHAPGLITETATLRPDAVPAALAQSAATGEAAAPGIERVKASGTLTVKPDAGAFEVVGRMIRAGVLSWDGSRALAAAEGEVAS